MEWKKPQGKRLKFFLVTAVLYIIIAWFTMYLCAPQIVFCADATLYEVPSYFPNSQGCYACTTSSGLFAGYVQLVIVNFILPLVAFYFLAGIKKSSS